MWSNAGLSTSILITTCSPANGMVHHTVAKIFVSTKLRDLGPKSSTARAFWKMVAACIRYQPPTEHLLWGLTTFSLASVKAPSVGTGFLGLAVPFFPSNSRDDTPELPQILSICSGDHILAIGGKDVLRVAIYTPLPPVGLLETVLLSLKEGEILSESTIRRLRRKEAERRAAAAEGRTPLSEYRRRKQKKVAARASTSQATLDLSSEKEMVAVEGLDIASGTRVDSPTRRLHQKPATQSVVTINLWNSERRKVSAEDIERLAASVSTVTFTRNPTTTREKLAFVLLSLHRGSVDDTDT